jgi:hypothetical protein
MNDMTIISAWLMPKGINVEPEMILLDASSDVSMTASLVYHLDWFNTSFTSEDMSLSEIADVTGRRCVLAAVVQDHDSDYLENGPQDINMLASTFLKVDEPVIGDTIIFCVADAEQMSDHVYDEAVSELWSYQQEGNSDFDCLHFADMLDLPEWVAEFHESIVAAAAESWNNMVEKVARVAVALERGLIDEDTLSDLILAENVDLLEMVASAASMTDEDMDAGLRDLLGD